MFNISARHALAEVDFVVAVDKAIFLLFEFIRYWPELKHVNEVLAEFDELLIILRLSRD
jgi:hypothetical protein